MDYQWRGEIATREWASFRPRRSTPLSFDPGEPHPAPTLARDFRITTAQEIGQRGPKEKVAANLAAIRNAQNLETEKSGSEHRSETLLVSLHAVGAFPSVFEPYLPREWKSVAGETSRTSHP